MSLAYVTSGYIFQVNTRIVKVNERKNRWVSRAYLKSGSLSVLAEEMFDRGRGGRVKRNRLTDR